jgi:hypothetical protein
LIKRKDTFPKQASIPGNVLLASYNMAYRVAKCQKPRSIVEELILLAAVDMVNIMVGESAGRLLLKVAFTQKYHQSHNPTDDRRPQQSAN